MKQQLFNSFWIAAASVLISSPAFSQVVQITNVQLKPTENGLEVILETPAGEQLQVLTRSEGDVLIADIPNTQLAIPEGSIFRSDDLPENIAGVTVTQFSSNSIRITAIGKAGVPTARVVRSDASGGLRQRALILSVTPAADTIAERPTPTPLSPDSEQSQEPAETVEEAVPNSEQLQEPAETVEEDESIEIVVTGEQETGYSVPNATTGTRTDTPIRDIPQSVQVVPEQVLEDQQVIRVGDALQNISGVVNQGNYSNQSDLINIRGFITTSGQGNFFRDGIRSYDFGLVETANLERIEVLKGPASVLFGQAQPGGIVNFVTKKPLREPFYSLEGTIGSYDTYRGSFDISNPLTEDRRVLYRLNGFYENSDSFRDFVEGDRFFIAPVLTWEIGPNTSLQIDAELIDDSRTMDDGIPAIGDRPADIPRSRFLSEPFSNFSYRDYKIGYVFDHRFSDNWSVRNAFRAQWVYPERYYPFSSSLNETTGELSRVDYWAGGEYKYYSTQTDLIGRFATGSIQHQLLFGFEYAKEYENPEFRCCEENYPSINIFNPVYSRERYPKEPNFFRNDQTTTIGVYIQDQITLLPELKLLVGGRFDNFDQKRGERNLGEPEQEFEQSDSKFSPRLGIVYQPSETVSLYASYTSSFKPSFGTSRNFDGSTFDPETATQYEVGIKADFFDGRLSTTLAAFDLKKQNVVTEAPDDPRFSIQTGEQTSRGIELDVVGEILPGWNIIASAAYIDAFISEDNTLEVGNRLDNVAEFSSSLWTTYEIQSGNLQGLGFGLGLFYVGDRFGDLDNSYVLPSYLRTDAAIYYRRNNWRAALNIKNLFDVEYFTGSDGGRVQVQPGAPLTVLGTFSLEF